MANHYRSVLASGGGVQPTGDAIAADVLTGKTFSNANTVGITGTMPNNGAVSGQATPSQPYTIPAGYHNGSGVVTASGANKFELEYFAPTPATLSIYQYISKQFLDDNGFKTITVEVTSGSAYLFNNATLGGTPSAIATVSAGSTQTFNTSQVTAAYLQIGANQHAKFTFE